MTGAGDVFVASAGLDLLSGVFGYLAGLNAQSVANSRADMIRAEADANAQRYSEQATAQNAQRAAMYLASGVTLAGSPIDVLDKQAQIAGENAAAIRMQGETQALDEQTRGDEAEMQGRNALLGGIKAGAGAISTGFGATPTMMRLWAGGEGGNPNG